MALYGKKSDDTYKFITKSINKNIQKFPGDKLTWNFEPVEWNYNNEYTHLLLTLVEVPYQIDEQGNYVGVDGNRVELDFFETYGENGPALPVVRYRPIVNTDGSKTYPNLKFSIKCTSGGSITVLPTDKTNNESRQAYTPDFDIYYTELELQPATIPHKDNSQVHLTPSEKTDIMNVPVQFADFKSDINVRMNEFDDFLYGEPGTLSEYDSKTILGVTGVSAARIHFFYMGCENFYGSLLKSISIPRPQSGFPLQDTDTAHIQPVWLYGDCYDENGELVDTIVSETSAQQLDDEFVTTWTFNNRVRGYWKKIKFGISLTETPTDEDRNPPIKSRILLCQTINKALSAGGWGIINQDNVNDSDKTLNFQIGVFNELNTNIKGHIENTEIHVTQADKDRWDRGNNVEVVQLTAGDFIDITNNAISVNTSSSLSNSTNTVPTTAAVYAHSSNNSLHVTSSLTSEVAKISTLQTTVSNHIGDGSHLTDSQKNSINQISTINSNLTELTSKVSELESSVADNSEVEAINETLNIDSGEYYRYSFDTPISSDYANDKENLATQMIRFGKLHFPTGRITEIELPYEYGKSNLTVYLAVQVVKKDESKDVVKTAAETVYSSNAQSQSYRAKGTSVFKFDNLIIPDDYQYVRLAFVPNTSTVPTYNGSNCTTYGITVVDLVSDTDSCRLITDGFESRYGVQCRVKYAKSYVIQQLGSEITNVESNVTAVDSKITNHIGDASHLTDAQKTSISQISTISSDLNTHKTNGGTLHVTSDEKSKWSGHVDNNSLHVSATYKQDITNAIANFEQHKFDEDIHFSKSEIMDNVAGSLETWDMSLGASVKGAQGIAYAQICNTHVLQQGSYLTKITVPQHTNPQASEVTTGVDLYLVIFGDNEDSASSDESKWEFVACSTNEGQQQVGGNSNTKPDMVFEFEKGIDLGLYRRYRFFYVTDRTVTPTLPTFFGSGYTGVKMAFPSRGIDANCKVRMTGGGWASSHTYPAIITFIKDSAELRSINHKENDEKHLTVGFRDTVSSAISKISEIEDKINDINFVLGVEKQEYTTFSSELPVPTDITNHDTTQILLASSRCVSGKIKKIEIPYTKGKGTTGYLAVQIIHSGESANIEKTLEDTYFSIETQTQTSNQSGVSTFHFDNLFIPSDFYAIRFSFVSNKDTVPNYGGSNCLTYAIKIVSITESDYSNPVHNHDGYKVFNPATQGYGYSNTDYGVIVSVESVKSSFDFISGELYRLKKVIS